MLRVLWKLSEEPSPRCVMGYMEDLSCGKCCCRSCLIGLLSDMSSVGCLDCLSMLDMCKNSVIVYLCVRCVNLSPVRMCMVL